MDKGDLTSFLEFEDMKSEKESFSFLDIQSLKEANRVYNKQKPNQIVEIALEDYIDLRAKERNL